LSPARQGRDHVVTRGSAGMLRAGARARTPVAPTVELGPCRGVDGVLGRHSRVFVRCRPRLVKV